MSMIEIKNLTKNYGDGRGLFDVSISVKKGEVFGFVGTNGAGKTTTIRHLMGFLKQQSGSASISGLDCWKDSARIKGLIGYVPGEIAFPDASTGMDFLKSQAELLGFKDMSHAEFLINELQLDPSANLRRMSKGMKQKTAIVAALMSQPEILILDEPTTGLDPLMRARFINIIKEEKRKGKTIFMSSHMFEEVEDTCDRVALIKDGIIIDVKNTDEIKHHQEKEYEIDFNTHDDYKRFLFEKFSFTNLKEDLNQITVKVNDSEINRLTKTLTDYDIKFISEIKFTLDKYFKSLY